MDSEVLPPFSRLVVRIRDARGYSQSDVSKRAGVSGGYVGMIERGSRGSNPSRDVVMRLADGLRATKDERDELLRTAGYPPDEDQPPATFEEAVNTDPKLRADQKRVLLDLYGTMVRSAR